MKALYVFFLIALITCNDFAAKDLIYLNDVDDGLITYSTFGSKDYIEIIEFSPNEVIRNKQLDAKIVFKAKKNVDIKKMILTVKYHNYELTENVEINKSLSEGEIYTYENSKYLIPSNMMGKAKLFLKLINNKNVEIYHARFNLNLKKIVNASISYKTCGSTDYLEITDFSPKEVKPGETINAKLTVKAKKDLEVVKISYQVTYLGIPIYNGELEIDVKLGAGESYSKEESGTIPSVIPPGSYDVIAKAYNSAGTELYCADFSMVF